MMDDETPDKANPDYNTIMILYALFGTSLVLSLVPNVLAAAIVLILITGVLIAAYVIRGEAAKDSLKANHMNFIIRTVWIGTLFGVVTTFIGTIYMMNNIDYTPIYICMDEQIGFDPYQMLNTTDQQVLMMMILDLTQKIKDLCMPDFMDTNMRVFLNVTLITAAPVLFYFLIRFARGFERALKGYRVQKPESWF